MWLHPETHKNKTYFFLFDNSKNIIEKMYAAEHLEVRTQTIKKKENKNNAFKPSCNYAGAIFSLIDSMQNMVVVVMCIHPNI